MTGTTAMRRHHLAMVVLFGPTAGVRAQPHHWVDVFVAKASGEKLPMIRDRIPDNVRPYARHR